MASKNTLSASNLPLNTCLKKATREVSRFVQKHRLKIKTKKFKLAVARYTLYLFILQYGEKRGLMGEICRVSRQHWDKGAVKEYDLKNFVSQKPWSKDLNHDDIIRLCLDRRRFRVASGVKLTIQAKLILCAILTHLTALRKNIHRRTWKKNSFAPIQRLFRRYLSSKYVDEVLCCIFHSRINIETPSEDQIFRFFTNEYDAFISVEKHLSIVDCLTLAISFHSSRFGDIWSIDCTLVCYVLDGNYIRAAWAVIVMDLKTRFIVGWDLFETKPKADDVLCVFASATRKWGIPRKLLRDHGRELGSICFDLLIKHWHIDGKKIHVHSPWENGLVERLNRSLKGFLLSEIDPSNVRILAVKGDAAFPSFDETKRALSGTIELYHNTNHSTIESTPSECRRAYTNTLQEAVVSNLIIDMLFTATVRHGVVSKGSKIYVCDYFYRYNRNQVTIARYVKGTHSNESSPFWLVNHDLKPIAPVFVYKNKGQSL